MRAAPSHRLATGWPQLLQCDRLSAGVFPVKHPLCQVGREGGGGHRGKMPHLRGRARRQGACWVPLMWGRVVCARQVDPSAVGSMAGWW